MNTVIEFAIKLFILTAIISAITLMVAISYAFLIGIKKRVRRDCK
jgi:hypothetical protein